MRSDSSKSIKCRFPCFLSQFRVCGDYIKELILKMDVKTNYKKFDICRVIKISKLEDVIQNLMF